MDVWPGMWARPLALGVLVLLATVACGSHTDQSAGAVLEDGGADGIPDASAFDAAGPTGARLDAGASAVDAARADAARACEPDPTIACSAALTCFDDGNEYPSSCGPANCDRPIGPCRAGECMHVDLSSYDRSCTKDADCIAIQSLVCPNQCGCVNAAINAAGGARYAAAISQIPQAAPAACNGCNVPAPTVVCAQGVCTYCQPGVPGCGFGVDAGRR